MTYWCRLRRLLVSLLGLLAFLGPGLAPGQVAAGISSCPGDCSGDRRVTVDELVRGVSIALQQLTIDSCLPFDHNDDGRVTIDELLAAVAAAVGTCPAVPTPTGTIIGEATSTPIPGTVPPTATPTATPFGAVGDLVAVIDGGQVRLGWTNPDPAGGYTQALVLRRLNAPVEGPEDPQATLVFLGSAAMAAHPLTNLLPDVPGQARVYHYAVFPCTAFGDCGDAPARATLTPTLPEVLRGGGYVLHWRHAAADVCKDHEEFGSAADPLEADWWKSCETDCDAARAQQLSAKGRADAVAIGEAFDILRIPIGRVVSTEFCRGVTTAELMDFGPPVETSPALTYFVYDEAQRCASSYALIATIPEPGTNTALIGHAGFAPPCAVLSSLAAGEAAIFKPDGAGGETYVTRLTAGAWSDLLPAGPSGLSAKLEQTHVRLTWVNGATYPTVRLLRRLNAAVDGPDDPDAQLVYAGAADTVLEPLLDLLPTTPNASRLYHYAVYGCVDASCEQVGSQTILAPTTVDVLRAGGYVIFWRHASAFTCQDRTDLGTAATTTVPDWWKSCDATCSGENVTATARQLSDIGRNEATAIGEAFAMRGIPVGRVLSSEFCRARQTAELMDFDPPIETSPDLTYFVYDEANRCAATFQRLAQSPPSGSNTALIGHAGNACPPLSILAMGGAAIYKPNGSAAPILIDTANWEEWGTLP